MDAERRAPVMSERKLSLLGALLVVLGPISMALYTPALPELVRDFGTTDAVIKLTLAFYFGGFALTQLFVGPLSDAFGRRPVAIAFLVIYVGASIAASLSAHVEVLLIARLIQGVGASVGITTSRAIVRDCFSGAQATRIMNLIGVLLAIGPAVAPSIGGLMLTIADWRAIFYLMVGFGLIVMFVVIFVLEETGHPDPSAIHPTRIASAYGQLLTSSHFMTASLTLGVATGAVYTMANLLPFLLIEKVGLSPQAFGAAMIAQSGSFLVGSLVARAAMRRYNPDAIVPFGISLIVIGSMLIGALSFTVTPIFISVMGPVAIYVFGVAFVFPAMTTAALHPFPAIAGVASALTGFIQMGAGFVGGSITALFSDPITGFGSIVPVMGGITTLSYLIFRSIAARTPPTAEPRGRLLP